MGHDVRAPSALTAVGGRRLVVRAATALLVLAAVVVYATTDSEALKTACYLGVLVAASLGASVGAARAPRGQRLVPVLMAAGVSLTALGDVVWSLLEGIGADTDVSIADVPWFVSYAVLCAALWTVLGRYTAGGRADVDYVIDVITIVVVSVLVFWSLSITTIVADQQVTPVVRAVWATYPVADAVLLALLVRVLMSPGARATIGALFGVGVCLWLAADLLYLHAADSVTAQTVADVAWMVAPVLVAGTAWRAASAQRDQASPRSAGGSVSQIVVAVAPLLVPPALELMADLRGQPDQPVMLLAGTTALITLAFVRTARLVHSEQHARLELEAARDAALDASRAKSMFLANVSHEVRTPLTTMLATAELLEDTLLDNSQLLLLTKLQRSGGLLRALVEEILDFSRIEAGRLELVSEEFELHDLVVDLADTYLPRAAQAGLEFRCDLDPRLPRTVVGDPGRLFQVLTNLLDNALKFTDHGTVDLVVRPTTSAATGDGELVELVVRDTGVGIGHADQAAVFESFRQIDGSTTRRHGGSGLGLAICKELVDLMGGSITLHSQLGAGTTFVVRLPMARPVPVTATPDALPLAG